jgi:hypothetical protein
MGQEFFIKSETLESKIRELLPSQGGLGAGFDLSGSTQIVPIIDLTESAEGSNLRQDLQTSISFSSANTFDVSDGTTTVITNTGYWRIIGCASGITRASDDFCQIILNDGSSDKVVWEIDYPISSIERPLVTQIDLTVFLPAGHSLKFKTNANTSRIVGSVRQVATIDGTLVNP